jgi:nitrilase
LRMAMYSKGVQIYCAPTADMRATWLPTMQHIALEGRCFVLSANQFVRQSDYPKDLWGELVLSEVEGTDSVVSTGGSCIVSPLGKVLAGPNHEQETILTAEIDLDEIVRGKYDFDVVGHYARPDVFQLHVNEAVQSPVVTSGTKIANE